MPRKLPDPYESEVQRYHFHEKDDPEHSAWDASCDQMDGCKEKPNNCPTYQSCKDFGGPLYRCLWKDSDTYYQCFHGRK